MSNKEFLRLCAGAALKRLEQPYIYHIGRDELYEIDDTAFEFLLKCDGTQRLSELTADNEFVQYCINEGLLELIPQRSGIKITAGQAPVPSLRYLELQLLYACNLKCRHCYLGPARKDIIELEKALKIAEEFSAGSGLRLLISGGEPLLYPHLKELIEGTAGLKIRRVLLTNGTLINSDNIERLSVENIQFSLDGWRDGHDSLRGKGAFGRAVRGIELARDKGISVSIATMVHKNNLGEFDRLKSFVEEIRATEWGIDALCRAGSLIDNPDLMVSPETAARYMKYAYGGGYHGSSEGYACGRHLMTVLPSGIAVKCGFYEDSPLGDASDGLIGSWLRLEHIPLYKLECRDCPAIGECHGGCRFRAPRPLGPDPVMCSLYGIDGRE